MDHPEPSDRGEGHGGKKVSSRVKRAPLMAKALKALNVGVKDRSYQIGLGKVKI